MGQTVIDYSENGDVIFNPERGWHKYAATSSQGNYSFLSVNTLNGWKNGSDKVSMVYRVFYMPTFINSPISQTFLNNIQTDMDRLRQTGLKAIVRFAYFETTSCGQCQPTKDQILEHIDQLSPVVNNNKDVIYSVQAGFIGGYGEWYYTNSTEFGDQSYSNYTNVQWNNRKEVVDRMLEKFDVFLQLRYPYSKIKMYGNSYVGRIGFFNDAFLNLWGDEGFYNVSCQTCSPSQSEINYLINQTSTPLPMTGETNALVNSRIVNTISEFDMFNWSVINRDYHPNVIQYWQNNNLYGEIGKKIGYRWVMKQGEYSINGSSLSYSLQIRNDGWASIVHQKKLIMICKHQNGTLYQFPIQGDARYWDVNDVIEGSIDISSLPDGIYSLHLKIEDINNPSLPSIRFANNNTWDNNMNSLLYNFQKNQLSITTHTLNNNIYPIPTKGILHLPMKMEKVNVYDITGKLLMKKRNTDKIDISGFPNGIYILKTESWTYKIIKE